jgi:pilus assembly protein CpaD
MTKSFPSAPRCVALTGCQVHRGEDRPGPRPRAVNEPVVSRADYVFDARHPGGMLAATEAARLDGWFRGLELGYGDVVSVDGRTRSARADVARWPAATGLLVADGLRSRRARSHRARSGWWSAAPAPAFRAAQIGRSPARPIIPMKR